MNRRGAIAILILGILAISAVVLAVWLNDYGDISVPAYHGEQRVFRGHYRAAFETSVFQSCSSREEWWVSGNIRSAIGFLRRRQSSGPAGSESPGGYPPDCYVEWRGSLSPLGPHGHNGQYQRELFVSEILTLRETDPGDCGLK